jgi:hypothetical protein
MRVEDKPLFWCDLDDRDKTINRLRAEVEELRAEHEALKRPLTEPEMYAVEDEARKQHRLSQCGPRGQQITYWDSLTPWLIRAVEAAHIKAAQAAKERT